MLSAVIDRFEEDKAILLIGEAEQKVVFPRNLLDNKLKEGDYITLNIQYDRESTEKAKKEIQDILNFLNKDNK